MRANQTQASQLINQDYGAFRVGFYFEDEAEEVDSINIYSVEVDDANIIIMFVDGQWLLQVASEERFLSSSDVKDMMEESLEKLGVYPPPFAVLSYHLLEKLKSLKSSKRADVEPFLRNIKAELVEDLKQSKYSGVDFSHAQ